MDQEQVFQQIVNESPAIAFVWRLEEGWPVEFVSSAIERFGYQPEVFLSGELQFADIIHVEDNARVGQEVAHYLEIGSSKYFQRYRLMAADGNTHWVDDWTSVIKDENGHPTHAHGILLDITDQITETERTQRAFDAAGTLFLHLDLQGNIQQANQNVCMLTGQSREDLTHSNWIDSYVAGESKDTTHEVTKRIALGEHPDPGEYVNEIEVSGQRYLIRWHFTVDRNEQKVPQGLFWFGHDITQTRAGEVLLDDIAHTLPGALFHYVIHQDGTDSITFLNEACESVWEIKETELDGGSATKLWGVVLAEDLPAMQQSVAESSETLQDWFHEWRIRSATGQIKWLQGRGRPSRLSNGDTAWNSIILDVSEAKQLAEAKEKALKKSVFALASVLEARDPYTAGHEQNVADICVKIARKMSLSPFQIEGLELAAIIHDIGKIAIPSEILSKPTGLTEYEYEFIKSHSSVGANMVRDIEFDWPIAAIIEQHHERLDGSGYPNGLRGSEICLEARIVAVADTLEAMASNRPYRPGLGVGAAVSVLEEGRGRLYDSKVVDACFALIEAGDINL